MKLGKKHACMHGLTIHCLDHCVKQNMIMIKVVIDGCTRLQHIHPHNTPKQHNAMQCHHYVTEKCRSCNPVQCITLCSVCKLLNQENYTPH